MNPISSAAAAAAATASSSSWSPSKWLGLGRKQSPTAAAPAAAAAATSAASPGDAAAAGASTPIIPTTTATAAAAAATAAATTAAATATPLSNVVDSASSLMQTIDDTPFSLAPTTPSPAAAAAAAAAQGMFVSAVSGSVRAKSPIISTANQINAKTTAKKKASKKGDLVDAVKTKQPMIKAGVRIHSTREQLLSFLKQGDPAYDIVKSVAKGFRFYGEVQRGDSRKGWYHIQYDLFPAGGNSLRLPRGSCQTLRRGEDEPQYDPKHDKVEQAIDDLELLAPEADFDLVLSDSDCDDDTAGVGDEHEQTKNKKGKRKKSRKILSLESFLNLSDDGVLQATSFNHYYGEGDAMFIKWDILQEGEEITQDAMQHSVADTSPFLVDIPWKPETSAVDYFDTFFKHFFPSLEGKAALLDEYLSNPECTGHRAYYVVAKVRFHQPDRPDPDYIVSYV